MPLDSGYGDGILGVLQDEEGDQEDIEQHKGMSKNSN